ncbi:MAG: hypothetical protein LBV30_03095 [Propionibacteriaceae bacterium]|jgi:hypothetical protein|nr:hypothetical protein [Propionibacteriaceae bacterium]
MLSQVLLVGGDRGRLTAPPPPHTIERFHDAWYTVLAIILLAICLVALIAATIWCMSKGMNLGVLADIGNFRFSIKCISR